MDSSGGPISLDPFAPTWWGLELVVRKRAHTKGGEGMGYIFPFFILWGCVYPTWRSNLQIRAPFVVHKKNGRRDPTRERLRNEFVLARVYGVVYSCWCDWDWGTLKGGHKLIPVKIIMG